MPPPTVALSEIIFPEQANHNFSKILGDLKRSNLSITNRLKSVRHDAEFVGQVAESLSLPLVANERCGSWYIDPGRKAGSAYFKSTDGHTGQWKFSTRRLNLHLLELIGRHDGCIIVDSTRRGKRMPDALSKTVPVWCCVLNRVLFPDDPSFHELYVPPNVVSDNEKSQMEGRIPEFIASFLALDISLSPLRAYLKKPLRPMWITQDDDLLMDDIAREISRSFHPVICCTSSKRVIGAEMSEAGYIQGAGDDTENWALGLTAPLFWQHADELLSTDESGLPDLIRSLVARGSSHGGAATAVGEASASSFDAKQVAPCLFVAPLAAGKQTTAASSSDGEYGVSCIIALAPKTTEPSTWVKSPSYMEVGVGKSKAASRMLRDALPQICDFVSRFLGEEAESKHEKRITILCESGKDLSVGVALCLYCWCFDAKGEIRGMDVQRETFTKNAIRIKLGQIMMAQPDLNPSRATLQSVNSFLMDWRK